LDNVAPIKPDRASFPSGRWRGYWLQGILRGRMELDLHFGDGRIYGDGRDLVGDFMINGAYDPDAATCTMLKAYLGGHDVDYDGVAVTRGIRGAWWIFRPNRSIESTGFFHIWPAGSAEGDADRAAAEAEIDTEIAVPV